MNFATSTQLRLWRFTREELQRRRAAARQAFLDDLVANPAGGSDVAKQQVADDAVAGTAEKRARASSSTTAAAADGSGGGGGGGGGGGDGADGGGDGKSVQLSKLKLSLDEEQLVLRSWMIQVDCIVASRNDKLELGPFVRATAWTFLHRFYISQVSETTRAGGRSEWLMAPSCIRPGFVIAARLSVHHSCSHTFPRRRVPLTSPCSSTPSRP
jgi:hypothetical protein